MRLLRGDIRSVLRYGYGDGYGDGDRYGNGDQAAAGLETIKENKHDN
jgi:hypothetical protein